ncbi:uncharacterized protein B0H18DRAFT_1102761 [Fomitopsis serialis]|uniref:uncharacterized protein n=1 Tax=Fomitopsis serialis TaxID=139415 RepID=UPI0020088582|nr:uncharacterized protein B0H18DRAFT_1102761 [Neoantrodia serialis]KAH9931284.1 hypothetical protein B0H18DRAFT_1102761 [Neoantrodia serialis]
MDIPSITSETMASLVRLIDTLARVNDDVSALSLPTLTQLDSLRGLLRRAEKEVGASKNAYLPVVCLPPEILQYIFRLASIQDKDAAHPHAGNATATGDIWSVVEPVPAKVATIVKVCRRWRSVAFADLALWSLITDRRDRRPLAVSRQSSSTPLELRLLASPSPALRGLLQSDGHRVKSIEWDKANARTSDLDILASPACQCRLEKLVLGMNRHLPALDTDCLTARFATQAQSLRQLTLRDCSVLPENEFPALTSLHLDGCPGPDACHGVMGMLARAPRLTDLVLSRLRMSGAPPRVALPCLRRLVCADMASADVARFLAHVDLPDDASIRLHASPAAAPDGTAALFAALARTPALRDATEMLVSGARDILVAGPRAAVCFVQPPRGARRTAPAWDAHAVLRHVLAATHVRTLWLLGEGVGGTGVPALPASLDTVVVHDVGLAVALGALARGAPPARPRTVHVLMTRFMAAGVVLSKLAQHADVAHVVVGYLPSYKGDRARPAGFDGRFASLRFEALAAEPRVALPEVCSARAHCLWPVWVE